MNTTIKATRHQLSESERELVSMRLGPVAKLLGHDADTAELAVELAVTSDGEKHGAAFHAEANLAAGRKFYRAEASAASMEAAIEGVHRELEQELRSDKGRTKRLIKKGGAAIKEMLRFGR